MMELSRKKEEAASGKKPAAQGRLDAEYSSAARKLGRELEAGASEEIVENALRNLVWQLRPKIPAPEGATPFEMEDVQKAIMDFFRRIGVPQKHFDDYGRRNIAYGAALDIIMTETLLCVPRQI